MTVGDCESSRLPDKPRKSPIPPGFVVGLSVALTAGAVTFWLAGPLPMKVTHALVLVVHAMLETPTERLWGYDLSRRSGVRSGVLYPILRRMLEDGWLTDGWEDPAETEGRPPRRYYELTGHGKIELARVMAEVHEDRRFTTLVEGWAAR